MTSLYDGLGGEEIAQSGLQAGATNISPYFTGSITTASNLITARQVVATGSIVCSSVIQNTDGTLNSVRQGASYGGFIQAGSNVTAAGSTAWVTFPVAYSAAPQSIVVANTKTVGAIYVSGTPTVGSFCVITATAADTFDWISVGVK